MISEDTCSESVVEGLLVRSPAIQRARSVELCVYACVWARACAGTLAQIDLSKQFTARSRTGKIARTESELFLNFCVEI